MLLHTPIYLLFLAIVCGFYWALPGPLWRKYLLLAASYGFYAAIDLRFVAVLAGLTLATYYLGQAVARSARPRLYLSLSLALNLGALGFFKYTDFFLASLGQVLQRIAPSASLGSLALWLPVGISFYTFQAMAYTIEIYRHKLTPAASLADFALYLAFFPKLLAGPFVRPAQFLRQVETPAARPRREEIVSALGLLVVGLFKKVVIADSLGALAEVAFRAAAYPPSHLPFPAPLYWQGFYLFAFQIYADFSGYTDIARASAALLGFALPENFQQPYLARSPADFWNRWHMTLTHWFREYLFFPLSRAGIRLTGRRFLPVVQTAANLITMLLIGLWHGGAVTYLAWGLWHGLWLSIDRWLNLKPARRWQIWLMTIINFHVVGVGWVLFKAGSLASALRFLAGMATFSQMNWWPHYLPAVVVSGSLILGVDWAMRQREAIPAQLKAWQPAFVTAALVTIIGLVLIRSAGGVDARPFIYGQF
jgi:D-alanyl-lipoteichoic acid acyltransferase DltB (MBOAT superfamily)